MNKDGDDDGGSRAYRYGVGCAVLVDLSTGRSRSQMETVSDTGLLLDTAAIREN